MFRRSDLLHLKTRGQVDAACAEAHLIRRGLYVAGDPPPVQLHRLRAQATLDMLSPKAALAGASAALMWGLPVLTLPADITLRGIARGRWAFGTRVLNGDGEYMDCNGMRLTSPAWTVADCARLLDPRDALVVADAALHMGLCTRDELAEAVGQAKGRTGAAKARWVLAEADPLAESPGETWTRMILRDLGYEPVSQYRIAEGEFVAYVDFMLEDRLGIEFDGGIKYTGPAPVIREKIRHGLAEESGTVLMRVVWQQLHEPDRIDRRIRAHGLRPTHRPRLIC